MDLLFKLHWQYYKHSSRQHWKKQRAVKPKNYIFLRIYFDYRMIFQIPNLKIPQRFFRSHNCVIQRLRKWISYCYWSVPTRTLHISRSQNLSHPISHFQPQESGVLSKKLPPSLFTTIDCKQIVVTDQQDMEFNIFPTHTTSTQEHVYNNRTQRCVPNKMLPIVC